MEILYLAVSAGGQACRFSGIAWKASLWDAATLGVTT
jgi:hypothetical protein